MLPRKYVKGLTYGTMMLACSCSSGTGESESATSAETQAAPAATPISEETAPAYDYAPAPSDIAMTVRSMAMAINEGEPLDSLGYDFTGVLTDGTGMPLFTDFEGFPGQWQVDVKNEREVQIHNIGTGDLMPGALIEYLTSTFRTDDSQELPELLMTESYDRGDTRVERFTYGRTSLQVETSPELLPTGEVGPKLQITLRYDTLTNQ